MGFLLFEEPIETNVKALIIDATLDDDGKWKKVTITIYDKTFEIPASYFEKPIYGSNTTTIPINKGGII